MPHRDCSTCTDLNKERWGCTSPPHIPDILDNEVLDRCALRPYKEQPREFSDLFRIYRYFKDGHYPDPGTWLDQSARLLTLVDIMDKAYSDASETQKRKESHTPGGKRGGSGGPNRRQQLRPR